MVECEALIEKIVEGVRGGLMEGLQKLDFRTQ